MKAEQLKKQLAHYVVQNWSYEGLIGIGTGTTVECLLEQMADSHLQPDACIPSSHRTEQLLRHYNFKIASLADGNPTVYLDGADACDPSGRLIKGGGGALTREKILAQAAQTFIVLIDETKYVTTFHNTVLPIEVIPMARSYVARTLMALGGRPTLRAHFKTDQGGEILDVTDLPMLDPTALEKQLNQQPGIIENGLFCLRIPELIYLASTSGIRTIKPHACC